MKHSIRRAVVAGTSLTVTAALGLGLAAPASAKAREEKNAVSWLSSQLTDGLVHNDQYDFDDAGLSIDVALAFLSLDRKKPVATEVRDAVAASAQDYVGYDPEQYSGATAKLLTLVTETGGDPTDVGGLDLVARLEGLVADDGATQGRIADQSEYGDYANVIGQTFAVRGLYGAGSEEAWSATKFLLEQQCAPGYFRIGFSDPEAEDQACNAKDSASDGGSAPNNDATALAVIALQSVEGHRKKVARAVDNAVDWLVTSQARSGAVGTTNTDEAPNTNSTGLAAVALAAGGACRAAKDAAEWVARWQVGTGESDTALADERGAIAFDKAAFKAGRTDGITVETQDQWRRASAQAAPALDFLKRAACQ